MLFHLHKLHDKQEFIFLQENVLEIDQVWVDQLSHHLDKFQLLKSTQNLSAAFINRVTSMRAKRFSAFAFVEDIYEKLTEFTKKDIEANIVYLFVCWPQEFTSKDIEPYIF